MKTYVLAEKLRRLGRRKPELNYACIRYARELDRALFAFGDMMSKNHRSYIVARRYYANAIGRAYDFGAEKDLEVVDAEPV